VLTREEVKAAMVERELVGGVEQGRLDVNALKDGAVEPTRASRVMLGPGGAAGLALDVIG